MKQHILPAIKMTAICIILFSGFYTVLILGIAQAAPNKGEGQIVLRNGKTIGYQLEGQNFTADQYFNGRPSAAGYNAAGSSGSNKGPSNPEYLKTVSDRIDTFLVHNPSIVKSEIPSDLVTASGSGLDPDISLQAAKIQVNRIAKMRNLNTDKINALIEQQKFHAVFNGIEKLNVLQLNLALDQLK